MPKSNPAPNWARPKRSGPTVLLGGLLQWTVIVAIFLGVPIVIAGLVDWRAGLLAAAVIISALAVILARAARTQTSEILDHHARRLSELTGTPVAQIIAEMKTNSLTPNEWGSIHGVDKSGLDYTGPRDRDTEILDHFTRDYWNRLSELLPLLNSEDQDSLRIRLAETDSAVKYVRQTQSSSSGPLSLEEVDAVAKRYAMWSARKRDHWENPDLVDKMTDQSRLIHQTLTGTIWQLDIELRREVEKSIIVGPGSAIIDLRDRVSREAGRFAAARDVAFVENVEGPEVEWMMMVERFDEICMELDAMLTFAAGD